LGDRCCYVVHCMQGYGGDEEFPVAGEEWDLSTDRGQEPLVDTKAHNEAGKGVHGQRYGETIKHKRPAVFGRVDGQIDDILNDSEGDATQGCQICRIEPVSEEMGPLPQEQVDARGLQPLFHYGSSYKGHQEARADFLNKGPQDPEKAPPER